jgi:Cd2+/Zn2+-exporting ATPase
VAFGNRKTLPRDRTCLSLYERNVSHPLGIAIVEAATERGLELPPVFGAGLAIPGKAVTARLKSGFASVGSPRHAAETAGIPKDIADRILALENDGKTVVVLTAAKLVEGLIALRDEARPDAAKGIQRLKDRGVKVLMLSGDNQRTANAIASSLGLEAKGDLLPDAKLAEIARLKEAGPVAMIGDGINDAPALAAASVGVSMGGVTDVALETADAALLRDRVEGVADLLFLSRAT